MKTKSVTFWTHAAMIAAIYVVLTFVFAPISFGEVQIRIAEMLTVLPIFTPAAIPGLFVGCIIGNISGGALLPDIVFGSLATLIGAMGTYMLRKLPKGIAVLPPIVANVLIVPFVDLVWQLFSFCQSFTLTSQEQCDKLKTIMESCTLSKNIQ